MDRARKMLIIKCLVVVIVSLSDHLAPAAELSNQAQLAVRTATFEIVHLKPVTDSVSYEKPLPMDLLPYSIRNDKYEPMGTAFAFGKDQFVTAAHVLHLGSKSQRLTPVLRDADGHVYNIDQVVKYSLSRDFVVFTLKEHLKTKPLKENTKLDTGETVFAVGNALGQGVVIRDGLYTSDTPEEQNGRWKWLRFSAAASPGNSGGPLLDKKGNVIGIVLRKSVNENLNYALPISEVINAPTNVATVELPAVAKLEVMDSTERDTLKQEYSLPMPIGELDKALVGLIDEFNDGLYQKLLDKNKDLIFPAGDSSHTLLHTSAVHSFPSLIKRSSDGTWVVETPTKVSHADLGHNGVLSFEFQQGLVLLHIRKPDDISHEQFYGDSKVFMDAALKGLTMMRNIGPERIRITSIGNATDDSPYVDGYGRKWQLRIWPIEFSDSAIVTLALPVPNGYTALMAQVPTASVHLRRTSFKELANFIYISFQGTLDLWREYLQDAALQPDVFKHIHVNYDYGHEFEYKSDLFSFKCNDDLQVINGESGLTLRFSYFNTGGKVTWNVSGVSLSANVHERNALNITRHSEPTADMPENIRQGWQRLSSRSHPFDAVVTTNNDITMIQTELTPSSESKTISDGKINYSVGVELEGLKNQTAMKERLDKFTKNIQILER